MTRATNKLGWDGGGQGFGVAGPRTRGTGTRPSARGRPDRTKRDAGGARRTGSGQDRAAPANHRFGGEVPELANRRHGGGDRAPLRRPSATPRPDPWPGGSLASASA